MALPPDGINCPNLSSIATKKFRLGLKGYNVKEVDEFLNTLGSEAQALQAALETAHRELAELRDRPSSESQ
jgi:DivIVA domain-containing protein